jgi:hypothetical protein
MLLIFCVIAVLHPPPGTALVQPVSPAYPGSRAIVPAHHSIGAEASTQNTNMDSKLPLFTIPISWLIFPTLDSISRAIAKNTRNNIYEYSSNYANLLMKHFSTETEVKIIDSALSKESESILLKLETEFRILQLELFVILKTFLDIFLRY